MVVAGIFGRVLVCLSWVCLVGGIVTMSGWFRAFVSLARSSRLAGELSLILRAFSYYLAILTRSFRIFPSLSFLSSRFILSVVARFSPFDVMRRGSVSLALRWSRMI